MSMRSSLKRAAFLAAVVLGAGAAQAQDKSLAQQIFEAMAQDPRSEAGLPGGACEGNRVRGNVRAIGERGDALQGRAFPGWLRSGDGPIFGRLSRPLRPGQLA